MARTAGLGTTKPARARTAGAAPASGNFHAVSVKCGKGACDDVRRIAALRFLSSEAPRLPLPSCSAGTCGCRYVHHADRRDPDTDDRGVEVPRGFAGAPAIPAQPDRRSTGADTPESAANGPYAGWLFLAR